MTVASIILLISLFLLSLFQFIVCL